MNVDYDLKGQDVWVLDYFLHFFLEKWNEDDPNSRNQTNGTYKDMVYKINRSEFISHIPCAL